MGQVLLHPSYFSTTLPSRSRGWCQHRTIFLCPLSLQRPCEVGKPESDWPQGTPETSCTRAGSPARICHLMAFIFKGGVPARTGRFIQAFRSVSSPLCHERRGWGRGEALRESAPFQPRLQGQENRPPAPSTGFSSVLAQAEPCGAPARHFPPIARKWHEARSGAQVPLRAGKERSGKGPSTAAPGRSEDTGSAIRIEFEFPFWALPPKRFSGLAGACRLPPPPPWSVPCLWSLASPSLPRGGRTCSSPAWVWSATGSVESGGGGGRPLLRLVPGRVAAGSRVSFLPGACRGRVSPGARAAGEGSDILGAGAEPSGRERVTLSVAPRWGFLETPPPPFSWGVAGCFLPSWWVQT